MRISNNFRANIYFKIGSIIIYKNINIVFINI